MILSFIPLWAVYGLLAALICTAIPLIQEKNRVDGFVLAVLVKLVAIILLAPLVWREGFPADPRFYAFVGATSVLWSISDIIYFRAVPVVGAGVVSRLLPSAVLLSFLLWFFVDPSLLAKYKSEPLPAAGIVAVMCLSAFFATRLKKCPVSWQGARLVWFVIFAACVGPLIEKVTLGYATTKQAPYAFVFVQACFMMGFWSIYFLVKKPVPWRAFLTPVSLKAGALIGVCSAAAVTLRFQALQQTEHPAYLSVLLFTDALWIVLIHRLLKRKDGSNIWAGLGIVFCAMALVIIKSLSLR